MEYVVIDLEFNQPFDFPKGRKTILVPECPFEVIQIGAVKMNAEFQITETRGFLSKPTVYKRIHPYVKKITGLNSEAFSKQPVFPEVYESFTEFVGTNEYVFCVWGGSDIKMLFDNISYYKLENKLTNKYIDVQQLASRKLESPPGNSVGLRNAVESFNLEIDEEFHDALNDARYTAKILQTLYSEDMPIKSYIPPEKNPLNGKNPDFARLYKVVEKEYGRQLNHKERKIARTIYLMGRDRRFDRS